MSTTETIVVGGHSTPAGAAADATTTHQQIAMATATKSSERENQSFVKKRQFLEPSGFDRHKRVKRARFLAFHMDILGLLYKDDTSVDAKVWDMTRKFLKQRERLMESKQTTESMKGIHDESLTHSEQADPTKMAGGAESKKYDKKTVGGSEEEASSKTNHNNNASPTASTPHVRNIASAKPSPVISQPFRGAFLSQTSQRHSPGGGSARHSTLPNNFHIVARLLGRRHQIMESTFQQQAQPFQPLLATALAQIHALQQELHHLRQTRLATDQKRTSDALLSVSSAISEMEQKSAAVSEEEERSRQVTLESKINLWSLLAQDLQEAIRPSVESHQDDRG